MEIFYDWMEFLMRELNFYHYHQFYDKENQFYDKYPQLTKNRNIANV